MELRDYQKKIIERLEKQPNVVLSVGMGLGKTLAVLKFLEETLILYPLSRTLIVAPKRVAENTWLQEAEKWQIWRVFRNMELITGDKETKRKKAVSAAPIKIISRDNLQYVAGMQFDILVIDELTSFKNMDAERTKQIFTIKADRKIGMTGTLAPNGLIDIYGQLAAVGIFPQSKKEFWKWRGTYFEDVMSGSGQPFKKYQLRKGMQITAPIEQARDKIFTLTAEDYLHIGPMIYNEIKTELTEKEKTAYKNAVAFLQFELPSGLNFSIDEKAKFQKLQTLCSGFVYDTETNKAETVGDTKIQTAIDYCINAKEQGEQVLLFYNYVNTALRFGEVAQKNSLQIASPSAKNWLQKWNNKELDVLVANPQQIGHGLNLQQGGHIILWLELTYNLELFFQSNARLHRQGQTKPVIVNYITAKDTIDERIFPLLMKKNNTNTNVINSLK